MTTPNISNLFGISGELWNTESILRDFSLCGLSDDKKINQTNYTYNLKTDFKAIGDGIADDTEAFLKVASLTVKCTVYIPEGTYIITKRIVIKTSISLIGSGIDKTILLFPKSLAEVYGYLTKDNESSIYTDSDAFISYSSSTVIKPGNLVGNVMDAKYGQTSIKVQNTSFKPITIGSYVLVLKNNGGKLYNNINLDYEGNPAKMGIEVDGLDMLIAVKVVNVSDNGLLSIKPRLPLDILSEYTPTLYKMTTQISDVCISDMTFKFPETKYIQHHMERGYNAMVFLNITNTLIKNIKMLNADSGIKLGSSLCCLLDSIELGVTSERGDIPYDKSNMVKNPNGHHGIYLYRCSGVLVNNFNFTTTYIHDITIQSLCILNAFTNGQGIDLTMDHHCFLPFANIFSNIDVGKGTSPFMSSGKYINNGPHTGNYTTFWNLKSSNPFYLPDSKEYILLYNIFGYRGIYIGLNVKADKVDMSNYVECTGTNSMIPIDIVDAMKKC